MSDIAEKAAREARRLLVDEESGLLTRRDRFVMMVWETIGAQAAMRIIGSLDMENETEQSARDILKQIAETQARIIGAFADALMKRPDDSNGGKA